MSFALCTRARGALRPVWAVGAGAPTANAAARVLSPLQPASMPRRWLSLHEFENYAIMQEYGIRVPAGRVATTPAQAEQIATEMLKGAGGGE